MTSIKITQLANIGSNIAPNTIFPVVNMAGTPTTQKANLQILGNLILNGAGGANFASINISNHSSNTQILFNDANVLSGIANLTINKVSGNLTTPNNMSILGSRLNLGADAPTIDLLAPTLVAAKSDPAYVQASIFNTNDTGSSDFITYGAYGNDEQGWNDFGFAGQSFNDPNYTITGPGDGYLFVQTYANGNPGGNLVLATGNNSTVGDIIFATGGFAIANEKARLTSAGKLLLGKSASTDTSIIQANGNVSANSLVLTGIVKTGVFTTSTLPAAATAGAGARAFVTDATSTAFAAAYVGGAANAVPVYSDGTNWYIG